ncbi:MAG: RelA/SpoT domain-containing protein [Candidatus Sungbacteria bacterium]|uniref:RelA/SpoT domain-containing protein n=1 Tax=Candidatus Sungiibacteriota bacterium TaxID=2750080 RepID=A0A9D6QYW9_9BACT|nr:RelA/SpoT domain-containing protein [Candidatus Sungbacteria bacterium]
MGWTKLNFSKNQVNKAGDVLISSSSSSEEISNALDILTNWRSSHSFPLHTFAVRLKRISKRVDSSAIVTRRLKRVSSIIKKLKRDQTSKMKMSRMQDVGGCRSVLPNLQKVNELVGLYEKSRGLKHKLSNKKDYITNPKPDGYRSFHFVYKYYSDKSNAYDGLLIEIQIRTYLQHYWATAVETVDHFTRQAIKSNEGQKEWMDFFRLVSSAFANMENTPSVPNTPTDKAELREQVQALARQLKVVKKMNEWARIHKIIENFEKEAKDKFDFYLLNLDLTTRELKISAFKKSQEEFANSEYSKLEERMLKNKEDRDIVLVSADTAKELRKAYPNYFLDTKEFVNQLNEYFKQS